MKIRITKQGTFGKKTFKIIYHGENGTVINLFGFGLWIEKA